MNILLTGANGFLGRSISSHLSGKNNFIYSLSKSVGDYKISLSEHIPDFKHNFELIIHAAGKAHKTPTNKFEVQEIQNVNVNGTANLLIGLEKTVLPKQFVFISTVSVYGLDFGLNIKEEHKLLAKDPYGLSKIKAEKLVYEWCEKHKIICTILRLPLVVGPNPPGNLGSMIKAIKKGYYLNISGGRAKKSMVFIEDIARYILKAAQIGGVYNLTDGYHPSFLEISNLISKQLNKNKSLNIPIWIAMIISFIGDLIGSNAPINSKKLNKIVSNLTFDDKKARKAFGWMPSPVLKAFEINYTNS
jgi:nucleoside-diphosphate-sugar epimerase